MTIETRSHLARLLASAIAYHVAGKPDAAGNYADQLVDALRAEGILPR